MAEHLAFDQLETIGLSFRLSIAPGGGESGADRAAIASSPAAKVSIVGHAGCSGLGKPGCQLSLGHAGVCLIAGVAGAHESGELARQFRDDGCVRVLLDTRNDSGIRWRQFCRRLHE